MQAQSGVSVLLQSAEMVVPTLRQAPSQQAPPQSATGEGGAMNKAASWRYDHGQRPIFEHQTGGVIRRGHVLEGGGVEIDGEKLAWPDNALEALGEWLIKTFGEGR